MIKKISIRCFVLIAIVLSAICCWSDLSIADEKKGFTMVVGAYPYQRDNEEESIYGKNALAWVNKATKELAIYPDLKIEFVFSDDLVSDMSDKIFNKDIDAIILAYCADESEVSNIKKATRNKAALVVCAGYCDEKNLPFPDLVVQEDLHSWARMEVEKRLTKKLNSDDRVLILDWDWDNSQHELVLTPPSYSKIFLAALESYPDMLKVVKLLDTNGSSVDEEIKRNMDDVLKSYPQIDAIIAPSSILTPALLMYRKSGRPDLKVIIGYSLWENAPLRAIKNKSDPALRELFSGSPKLLYEAMHLTADHLLKGKKLPKMVNVPPIVINEKNVDFYLNARTDD